MVASRREAMMRKRQLFYFSPDTNGEYRVREGRAVQARVIAVADKSIRVEIFGVECSIMARDLAWDWIGDAHDRFAVGDQILVRVTEVNKTSQEKLSVHADVKSVTENTSRETLKRCRVQSKYAGRVTDVHKGIVYVRLSNGVNAVAHSCYDRRTPGKKGRCQLCGNEAGRGAQHCGGHHHPHYPSESVTDEAVAVPAAAQLFHEGFVKWLFFA